MLWQGAGIVGTLPERWGRPWWKVPALTGTRQMDGKLPHGGLALDRKAGEEGSCDSS